ncbi:MAG: SWIM zinc finger family protein [Lachnospiraceae bacterium]|nr:SWIM zinc finger family protein [Lachnospiraceae bacterium]
MREITEQQILALAPNAAAASNGRKISQKGGFVKLERTQDDTLYMGECTGSGKSNYITSADCIDENNPVFRCTCPSRQFPCKHSLALMYEILAKKEFGICEVPEDIQKKREKKQAKENKANEAAKPESEMTEEEKKQAEKKKASAARTAKNARVKKLKSQLEGLDLVEKVVNDLMSAGLGTIGGASLKTYQQLAKQMGDYYLPGPQRLCNQLLIEITAFQKDQDESHYDAAISVLEKLWTLIRKSRQYINEKLENDDVTLEDTVLYEELGGIWKLSELEELGKSKKNASLMQLSFWVTYDEARKEYIDTGCWADLDSGEIFMNYNYRPLKSLKYVRQEDSIFGVAKVPSAVFYPGDGNVRVRWDGAQIRAYEQADYEAIFQHAVTSVRQEAKAVKNFLKNAMTQPMMLRLLAFNRIGKTGEDFVLADKNDDTILLGNMPDMEETTLRLSMLPNGALLENQVLLGAFYYNKENRRLMVQPLSIITHDAVVRLLY